MQNRGKSITCGGTRTENQTQNQTDPEILHSSKKSDRNSILGEGAKNKQKKKNDIKGHKICFDVPFYPFFLLLKRKEAMEHTFRAVTKRSGIVIWRIEVM